MFVIQALATRQNNTLLPQYDKSLRHGHGDRAAEDTWPAVNKDGNFVDVILFEGWMLGFSPHPVDETSVQGDMKAVNSFLSQPEYSNLHSIFDGWLVIALEDIKYVYDWRLDAEKKMINSGKEGMSDEKVR